MQYINQLQWIASLVILDREESIKNMEEVKNLIEGEIDDHYDQIPRTGVEHLFDYFGKILRESWPKHLWHFQKMHSSG